MAVYFTKFTFTPKQLTQNIQLVDYRTLSSIQKTNFNELIKSAMLTAIPEILCGGSETEAIAFQIEVQRRMVQGLEEMTDEEAIAFITQYRAEQGTRTIPKVFVGGGIVRFAVFTDSTMTGTVHMCQTSLLQKVGQTFYVKATPLYHRQGVNVYNLGTNKFTNGFVNDQAQAIRFALNTEFDVFENPDFRFRIAICDAHPRNTRFETMAAVIDYDTRLDTAISAFSEINTITAFEGTRPYNLYKLVTTNA